MSDNYQCQLINATYILDTSIVTGDLILEVTVASSQFSLVQFRSIDLLTTSRNKSLCRELVDGKDEVVFQVQSTSIATGDSVLEVTLPHSSISFYCVLKESFSASIPFYRSSHNKQE